MQGKHEPIISDEQFAQVQSIFERHKDEYQELVANRSKTFAKKTPNNIWGKKIKCECGCHYNRRIWGKKKDGSIEYSYQCHNQMNTGTVATRKKKGMSTEGICEMPMVSEWKAQMIAKEVFRACIDNVDDLLSLTKSMLEKHIHDRKPAEVDTHRVEDIEKEKAEILKRLNSCLELRIEGEISKEIYLRKKAEYEARIEDLDAVLREYANDDEDEEEKEETKLDQVKEMVEKLRMEITDHCSDGAEDIPDGIIDAFVEKVIVHKDSFDWYLRYSDNYNERMEGNSEVVKTLVLTEEKAAAFKQSRGKKLRKGAWENDVTVRVFL